VDEVEITNVGGKNGVASEVTLVKLQSAIENLAAKKGVDSKAANEGLKELYKSLGLSDKEIKKELEARGESTDALDEHTDALGKATSGLMSLGGAIIGSGIDSIKGLSREIISGSNNLSDFAQHIPLVGGGLSMLTGILDNSYNALNNMATSGGAFGYELDNLRSNAARAGLSLQEFSGFVNSNSEQLAAFGGTVTQGARRTSQMVDALGDQREQLLGMGLSFEDINEQLQMYQYINRAGSRQETRTRAEQADAAASLTKNMLTLSKLTGKDVKQMQEQLAQEQQTIAFQRELAMMPDEQRDRINQAMADIQQTGGQAAVEAFKAEFLGLPPVTRQAQLWTATQGENAQVMQQMVRDARNTNLTEEERNQRRASNLASIIENTLDSAGDMDAVLKASAAGVEGVPAEIGEIFNQNAELAGKYIGESGEFLRDKFEDDFDRGVFDNISDPELTGLAGFKDSLRGVRQSLTDNLINPLANLVGHSLTGFNDLMENFVQNGGLSRFMETIGNKLEEFETWFGGWMERFTQDPQAAWEDLMENHIKPFFDKAIQGVKDTIGSAFKDAITSPSVVGALVAGFGTLFAAKAVSSALTKGIAGMFARARAARAASTAASSTAGTAARSGSAGAAANSGRAGRLLKGGLRLGAKAALPLTAALGVFDAFKGVANAEDILGIPEGEEAGFGDKAAAAFGSALQGLSFGLINQESVARGLTGRDSNDNEGQQGRETSDETPQQDLSTAQAAATVSDAQIERLEKLVGFAPQVRILSDDIQSLEKTFNSLDLNYRHIDRTTRSLEKLLKN
jgi:hypothetical protein